MPLNIYMQINDLGSLDMQVVGDTELLARQAACVGARLNELIEQAELGVNPRRLNVLESYLNRKDPVVQQVIEMLERRSRAGQKKYGCGLDRTDLPERDWLVHLMEELADALGYAQRRLNDLDASTTEKPADGMGGSD